MTTEPQSVILTTLQEIHHEDVTEHLCATFTLPDQENPWVQVVDDFLNIWWPWQEEPLQRVQQLPLPPLPGLELSEADPGVYATFLFDTDDDSAVAAYIAGLFQHLYDCGETFEIATEIYAIADDEIPEQVPILREEDGPTHYLGSHEGGLFAGFVVGVYDEPRSSNPVRTWLTVLHLFTEEGAHVKTRFEVIGTSKEDEDKVIERGEERLVDWVDQLTDIEFGDIAIRQFQTVIDHREFGLIDTTWEDEETEELYVEARLVPNDLVFTPPWDGAWLE